MADNAHGESEFNADFGLDPSDPLYMLLNNAHDTNVKSELSGAPFEFPFPMDLDFNDPSFSVFVDPNALFIDANAPIHSPPTVPIQPQDLLNASFPFTFAPPTPSSSSSSSHSADESPSASGFSSSPGSPPSTRASPAIPQSTADAVATFFSQSNRPFPAHMPAPTHMMPQPAQQPPSSSPSPPPPIQPTQAPQTHTTTATAVSARPKTSHTTIERRYRTNLNARIQSLKATVPALRVLDQNYKSDEYKVDERGYIDGVKVARKGSKANVLGKAVEYIRVLKRREARLKREHDGLRSLICGFPGGQNILAEWEIDWINKFGGPERDEIDNEGAEEASEDEDGDGDGEDDDDNSERARKKPKIESKKEKRKIAPAIAISTGEVPVAAPIVVEKRKRGRPRKIQPNVPPPITAAAPVLLTDPAQQQGIVLPPPAAAAPQPQQYLLAVFALFSFFNSPLTSSPGPSPHHHTHQGAVLSHTTSASQAFAASPAIGWTWNDLVQIVHLLASLAVFVSIVVPWIPVPRKSYQSRLMQMIPFSSLIHGPPTSNFLTHETSDLPTPPDSPDISDVGSEADSSSTEYTIRAKGQKESSSPLLDALNSRGATDEFDNLLGALNITSGWIGMVRSSIDSWQARNGSGMRSERLAWTRLAELIVFSRGKVPMSLRWQVYSHLSPRPTSSVAEMASESHISELCTLALLTQTLPFTESRSQAFWTRATALAKSAMIPAYQRLVLDTMTVDDAVQCLATSKPTSRSSPIAVLSSILLRKRLHAHASSLFVHRVTHDRYSNPEFPSIEDSKTWRATISYGRSLGNEIGLLSDVFAEVWRDGASGLDVDALDVEAANENVSALLRATILYDRVFAPRSVLSPPPSPPSKSGGKGGEADVVLQLRQALGSSVFEESGETSSDGLSLEDARDRVVDMIVNLQRERRTRVGSA